MDNPNVSEDNWEEDDEADTELDYGINDPETTERQDMNAALPVSGLMWPIQWTKTKAEKVLMTVNTMEI